jgi:LysM repeat protein
MLVFVLMAAVATVFLTVARDPGPPAAGIPVRHVVVQPGQTLWSIAQQVAPGADPRGTVGQLERLNGLAGPQVYPGEALRVPAR